MKKEGTINPDIPAQLMEDSCLLMDDMLVEATGLQQVRTTESRMGIKITELWVCLLSHTSDPSDLYPLSSP